MNIGNEPHQLKAFFFIYGNKIHLIDEVRFQRSKYEILLSILFSVNASCSKYLLRINTGLDISNCKRSLSW